MLAEVIVGGCSHVQRLAAERSAKACAAAAAAGACTSRCLQAGFKHARCCHCAVPPPPLLHGALRLPCGHLLPEVGAEGGEELGAVVKAQLAQPRLVKAAGGDTPARAPSARVQHRDLHRVPQQGLGGGQARHAPSHHGHPREGCCTGCRDSCHPCHASEVQPDHLLTG